MYCPDCSSEIRDNASFCPDCGHNIGEDITNDLPNEEPPEEPPQAAPSPQVNNHGSHGNQAGKQGTHAPGASNPTDAVGAPEANESGLSSWPVTRLATFGGGGVAAVSLFLPWVEAIQGGFSANGMSTEFGSVVMLCAAVAIVGAGISWGRGWGRLTMLVTGFAGAGIAVIAHITQSMVSTTYTYGTMTIDGRQLPLAALEPATGIQLALIAGAIITLASLVGLLASFTSN